MQKLIELVEIISGTPQSRIDVSLDKSAPTIYIFNQTLFDEDNNNSHLVLENQKSLKTFDNVELTGSNDVVFSLISGKATKIPKKYKGYLLTQNYVKLVPTRDISTDYLVYVLNEDSFIQKQFQVSLQGSSVIKYTLAQLKELKMPELPNLKKQEIVGNVYMSQIRLKTLRKSNAELESKILLQKLKELK